MLKVEDSLKKFAKIEVYPHLPNNIFSSPSLSHLVLFPSQPCEVPLLTLCASPSNPAGFLS